MSLEWISAPNHRSEIWLTDSNRVGIRYCIAAIQYIETGYKTRTGKWCEEFGYPVVEEKSFSNLDEAKAYIITEIRF